MFDTTLPQEEDIRPPCPATNDEADSVDLFVRETHHRMKNMLTLLGAWRCSLCGTHLLSQVLSVNLLPQQGQRRPTSTNKT